MNKEQKQEQIAALLNERRGAVQYGRTDTVEQIDQQLAILGHEAKPPSKRATKMTRKSGTEL